MDRKLPNARQIEFLNWEFGVFFHFGIRSFFPGHADWDNRPMPAEKFNPESLDCEAWIRDVRDAGAKYAILVCKHHDGFANWPTNYSDYGVKNTPWKGGKGDVVREFTDACRKYDIKVGLYYSPAQWGGETSFADEKAYDDYFIDQISELLTGYGKIDYLWFDGCGSENHEYDKERIIGAIRGLQPEILIFNMWDPDTCWVGNEDGYAPMNNLNLRDDVDFSVMTSERESLGAKRYLPAECDCKMRSTWFDDDNADTVKTLDELVGMYEMSVGRGANFLLNIGPDSRGLLPEPDRTRLLELGAEIHRRYGRPIEAFGEMKSVGENAFCIKAESAQYVNRVVITEDLLCESPAESFSVYVHLPVSTDKRICVYRGGTIGHKVICSFSTVKTAKIILETDKGAVTDIKAFYVK